MNSVCKFVLLSAASLSTLFGVSASPLPHDELHSVMESVVLGVALGDAFGSGIEGRDRHWIHENVDFTKYVNAREGVFCQGYRLGDYSDDTSDTIALIYTIMNSLNGKAFNEDNLLEQIRVQYDLSKVVRNGLPRAGFGSITWVFEEGKSLEDVRKFQMARDYPGNAPVMRAIPLGFLAEELIEPYSIINADVTHPHPKSRAASIVVARAARYLLIEKRPVEGLIEYCRQFIKHIDQESYDYLGAVDKLDGNVDDIKVDFVTADYTLLVGPQPIRSFMDHQPIVGLNSDSMRTAGTMVYLLKHTTSTFEALRRCMLMGGDVDSLAAIVVGIKAGVTGLEDIPAFILEGLEDRENLRKLSHEFADSLLK